MDKPAIRFAGASDMGRVRSNNEDALHLDAERGIFLVVDGMGGQAAGEKAAEIALDRIRTRLERKTGTAEQRIREAIAMANNEILQAARGNPEWEGMACVLTVAVLEDGSAVVGHVGDSRMYQIRGGAIRKITHDHSPVGEREDNGEISEAEAMRHPRRNEVFRDVGSEEHAPDDSNFIEVQRIPFDAESALLLCSDGLSDQVASKQIQQAVEKNAGNPKGAVGELIAAANAAGGKDNVTVLVVEGENFTTPPAANPVTHWRTWQSIVVAFSFLLILGVVGGWVSGVIQFVFHKAPPPPVPGAILTVGVGQKFQSIGEALKVAKPGDTVEVMGGEYHENITLHSGITLRSRVPRDAVLLGIQGSDVPVVSAYDVHNARLAGFRIRDDKQGTTKPSTGIDLRKAGVEVVNLEITGMGIGVQVYDSSDVMLLGNFIHDCETGAIVGGAGTPWIAQNEFRDNKLALQVQAGAQPALTGNVFDKNSLEVPDSMKPAVKEHNRLLNPVPATPKKGTAVAPAGKKE